MCRFLVWCGEPITLAEVVLESSNSLLVQSFEAGFHPGTNDKNNMSLNADGFGVGWYGKRGAAIFRAVTPAWTNRNLREMCGSIESSCIFAHVRAATPSSVVSEENCHPFRYGPLLFQHNGHVEGYPRIKRRLMNALPDDIFNWVSGTTDSEGCFALLLSLIDPASIASGRVSPCEMQKAMLGTIAMLTDYLEKEGVTTGLYARPPPSHTHTPPVVRPHGKHGMHEMLFCRGRCACARRLRAPLLTNIVLDPSHRTVHTVPPSTLRSPMAILSS